MGGYSNMFGAFANRGTTLKSLKDQLCSLNMRMLLAIENHDLEAQEDVKKQMAEIQSKIDLMGSGRRV